MCDKYEVYILKCFVQNLFLFLSQFTQEVSDVKVGWSILLTNYLGLFCSITPKQRSSLSEKRETVLKDFSSRLITFRFFSLILLDTGTT